MVVVVKDVDDRYPTARDTLKSGEPFVMMARETVSGSYYTYSLVTGVDTNTHAVFISKGIYDVDNADALTGTSYTVSFTVNSDKSLSGIGLEYDKSAKTITEHKTLTGTNKFYLSNTSAGSSIFALGTPTSNDTIVTTSMFVPNDSSLNKGELVAGKFYTLVNKDGNPVQIRTISRASANLLGGLKDYKNETNVSTFDIFFIPYSKNTSVYNSGKCTNSDYAYIPFRYMTDSLLSTAGTANYSSGCSKLTKDSSNCVFIGADCNIPPPEELKPPPGAEEEAKTAARQKIIIISVGIGIIMFMLLLMVILLRK